MRKEVIFLAFIAVLFASCSTNRAKTNTKSNSIDMKWEICANDQIGSKPEILSTTSYTKPKEWFQVEVPTTIFNGLIQNDVYTDIYFSNRLDKIDSEPFKQAWWYRSEFEIDEPEQFYDLEFEGINYSANIWLNGKLLADTSKVEGVFNMHTFDVSSHLIKGTNVLAIQVFPPKWNDLTIGFVDWNPAAPDNNMGLWRGVKLKKHGALGMSEPFIQTNLDLPSLASATITISTDVKNYSDQPLDASIEFSFNQTKFRQIISLAAHESKTITATHDEFPELHINNPKLWWPNHMGDPNLYQLNAILKTGGHVSDQKDVRFGIREVEDYWTEEGHRGYKINGEKVLIKGAGWVDDLTLADSDDKVTSQLEYVKHMNMNTVRLEGFWGRNKTIYEKADELGLLIMIGWSCQWEWEGYCGRPNDDFMAIRTPEDQELQARGFQDQVRWLRNHPSIFLWVYGSDKLPLPELESKLNDYIEKVDQTRPILASCKYTDFDIVKDENGKLKYGYINDSKISGPTGVKMLGPYAYTAPIYWYVDKRAGGAYGFNTETGPGAQVPPLESIKRMIPEDKLWPMNEIWDYHSGRNEFSTLHRDLEAFNSRYGETNNVNDFAFKMQIHNYEAIRAMFEAFEANKPQTTGLIQWMLNSAWPELFWQLYDWYLLPNGAFYGTQTANQPVTAIYNYGDKNIYVGNSLLEDQNDLSLQIKVYDIESQLLFEKELEISIESNSSKLAYEMPDLAHLSSTYFIDLRIKKEDEIAKNFYWLSTKPDVFDWENSEWFYSPFESYADFSALNTMPTVELAHTFTKKLESNGDATISCLLENKSDKIAFFTEVAVLDKATGETIVPVFWSDNYVSLLPGETRVLEAHLHNRHIENKEFEYRIKTFNGTN